MDSNIVLKQINELKKDSVKKKFLRYEHYARVRECIENGDIHLEYDDNDNLVGFIWLINYKKRPVTKIYEILSCKRGIGRKLMEYAFSHAKNHILELDVVEHNEYAIGFYTHFGFTETKRTFGKNVNIITMQKINNNKKEIQLELFS